MSPHSSRLNFASVGLVAVAGLLLLATGPAARAQLLAYESFNYTTGTGYGYSGTAPGNTVNAMGFTGTSRHIYGSGPDYSIINSGSLAYTDSNSTALATSNNSYQNSHGRMVQNFDLGGAFASYLRSGYIGANGTTLYMGVTLRASGLDGFTGFEVFRGGDDDPQRVGGVDIWNGHANLNYYLSRWSSGSLSQTADLGANNSSAVNFFVLRFDFASTGDSVSIHRNPTLNAEPGAALATLSGSGVDLSFDRISVSVFSGAGPAYVDEIRVGTTYASVTAIPEPSTYAALAGAAILGLAVWRRRAMPSD